MFLSKPLQSNILNDHRITNNINTNQQKVYKSIIDLYFLSHKQHDWFNNLKEKIFFLNIYTTLEGEWKNPAAVDTKRLLYDGRKVSKRIGRKEKK